MLLSLAKWARSNPEAHFYSSVDCTENGNVSIAGQPTRMQGIITIHSSMRSCDPECMHFRDPLHVR